MTIKNLSLIFLGIFLISLVSAELTYTSDDIGDYVLFRYELNYNQTLEVGNFTNVLNITMLPQNWTQVYYNGSLKTASKTLKLLKDYDESILTGITTLELDLNGTKIKILDVDAIATNIIFTKSETADDDEDYKDEGKKDKEDGSWYNKTKHQAYTEAINENGNIIGYLNTEKRVLFLEGWLAQVNEVQDIIWGLVSDLTESFNKEKERTDDFIKMVCKHKDFKDDKFCKEND